MASPPMNTSWVTKGTNTARAEVVRLRSILMRLSPRGRLLDKPVLLLEVQPSQQTVVGLGDAGRLGHGDLQLLTGLRRVQHQEGHVEHSLVAGLQVGEQVLRRAAISRQVAGEYVHIVAAAHRPFLLLYLHGVQIGDFPLDHFDGLVLVDAPDVHGHHDIPVGLHEVGEDAVVHLRHQDLQEGHRPVPSADAEGAGLSEVEGGRRNKVLHRKAAGREPVPFKGELPSLRVEDVVKQFQPFLSVQHMSRRPHDLEAVEGICLNAGKSAPALPEGSPPQWSGSHTWFSHSRCCHVCTASAGCPPPRPGWGPGHCPAG